MKVIDYCLNCNQSTIIIVSFNEKVKKNEKYYSLRCRF